MVTGDQDLIGQLNARIDRLPGWSLPWHVFLLVGVSYFFAFFDIEAIGFTLPTIIKQFHLTGIMVSLPVTLNLVGYIIGALFVGHIADTLGRRVGLMVTVILLTIGSILTALSWDGLSLAIFRFITGLGIGAELSIAAAIITEFSPNKSRARHMQCIFFIGALALGFTGLIARPLLEIGSEGWRYVFVAGALAGVVLIIARAGMLPESPRWNVIKGRKSEAKSLVSYMEETAVQRFHLQSLPDIGPVISEETSSRLPVIDLLKPPYIGRLALMTSFWFFVYLQSYSYYGYEPTLLIERGVDMHNSLLASALSNLGNPLGAILLIVLITKVERKYLIGLGIVMCGLLEIASLLFVSTTALTIILFFVVIFQVSTGAGYLLNVEMFPTRARTQGMAISDGLGHLGGAIAPLVIVSLSDKFGAASGFWVMGVSAIICGLLLIAFAPRVGNKRLQEISR